jgi:hypothetical protein
VIDYPCYTDYFWLVSQTPSHTDKEALLDKIKVTEPIYFDGILEA